MNTPTAESTTLDEARAYAKALRETADGMRGMTALAFYRDALAKSADVIDALCGKLSTAGLVNKEKGEREKRNPPAPPKEKSQRDQEKAPSPTPARACARENVHVGPSRQDVESYARRAKIDADYALWWHGQMDALGWCDPDDITQPVGNWRSLLRTWWKLRSKNGDDWKTVSADVPGRPRRYSRAEWSLCAERCARFDPRTCRCSCGCAVPPDRRNPPLPPEECAKFARKEAAA